MSVTPKLIYRFDTIAIKIPAGVFVGINVAIKCIRKHKGTRTAKTILRKKNKVGRISLPNFDNYSIATEIKAVCYWQRGRHRDQ